MYDESKSRLGNDKAKDLIGTIITEVGLFSCKEGFLPLASDEKDLESFIKYYKDFERNNVIFDVVGEGKKRFETRIKRCLIYETFNDLGIPELVPYVCEVAITYFKEYHPHIQYKKNTYDC